MIDIKLNETSQYQDHLSWVDTLRKPDIVAVYIDIPTFQVSDYEMILYEYGRNDKPAIRWKHKGKWKRGYTISFDMNKDYVCKPNVRYMLALVCYIQNIEVRYHVYINFD